MSYDYNKPRRFNVVSAALLLIVLAAGYAGAKFIPVYWKARKVDEALDEVKLPAAQFYRMNEEVKRVQSEKILAQAISRLREMGIEDQPDQPLQVWFGPEYSSLNAKYEVIVTHPAVLKPTVIVLERNREIRKY